MKLPKGTAATKDFYNRIGWQPQDSGTLGDWELFAWGNGAVQKALVLQRKRRLRGMAEDPGLSIVDLGCGANPAHFPG